MRLIDLVKTSSERPARPFENSIQRMSVEQQEADGRREDAQTAHDEVGRLAAEVERLRACGERLHAMRSWRRRRRASASTPNETTKRMKPRPSRAASWIEPGSDSGKLLATTDAMDASGREEAVGHAGGVADDEDDGHRLTERAAEAEEDRAEERASARRG